MSSPKLFGQPLVLLIIAGILVCGGSCFLSAVAITIFNRANPSMAILPTNTPPLLNLTIDQIENCCQDMMQIQETQYLTSLVGRRVNCKGAVDDVSTDGTIWIKVSSTRIEMTGATPSNASKLKNGQLIDFFAVITKAENAFLHPGVQLQFESLR